MPDYQTPPCSGDEEREARTKGFVLRSWDDATRAAAGGFPVPRSAGQVDVNARQRQLHRQARDLRYSRDAMLPR